MAKALLFLGMLGCNLGVNGSSSCEDVRQVSACDNGSTAQLCCVEGSWECEYRFDDGTTIDCQEEPGCVQGYDQAVEYCQGNGLDTDP